MGLHSSQSSSAMDPSTVAAATLAGHAGLTQPAQPAASQGKKNKVDPFGAVVTGLIHHMEGVAHPPPPPPIWGAELDDPELGPKIALAAEEAMKSIKADWGPVFVYGPMLLPAVWGELIGRVPEMAPAKIFGFLRRGLICSPEAALIEEETSLAVGQVVYGLLPWERKLVDVMMEDTFTMTKGFVRLIEDEEQQDLDVTLYLWREDFMDGVTDEDWSIETFEEEWLDQYLDMCRDMRRQKKMEAMADEELKEATLTGRRLQKVEEGELQDD